MNHTPTISDVAEFRCAWACVPETIDFFSIAKRALLRAWTQAEPSSDLVGSVQLRSWIDCKTVLIKGRSRARASQSAEARWPLPRLGSEFGSGPGPGLGRRRGLACAAEVGDVLGHFRARAAAPAAAGAAGRWCRARKALKPRAGRDFESL